MIKPRKIVNLFVQGWKMASNCTESAQQQPASKIQIYPPANSGVSPFWRGLSLSFSLRFYLKRKKSCVFCWFAYGVCCADKYEKDAKKYWDIFYKRHQDKVSYLQSMLWLLFC